MLKVFAKACAIPQALCWSRQHQQVCHFSSLLLSDSRSVLSSIFPFTLISLAYLVGTVFSLLLFYQGTMGPRTLVSPGERCGWWAGQTGSSTCALSDLLSSLSSFLSNPLFSDWRRIVSSKFFDTQVSWFPPRNLCFYVTLAVLYLVFAATDTAYC